MANLGESRTIVNVSPILGMDVINSRGYFLLPAKPENGRYSKLVVKDRTESWDLGDDRRVPIHTPAEQVANDLLKDCDGAKRGIFIAAGEEPTEAELKEAEGKFLQYCREILRETDTNWEATKKQIWITVHSRMAARILGEKRIWLDDQTPRKSCLNCSELNPEAAARCRCGYVLNWQAAFDGGMLTDLQVENAMASGRIKRVETFRENDMLKPVEVRDPEAPAKKRGWPKGKPRKQAVQESQKVVI